MQIKRQKFLLESASKADALKRAEEISKVTGVPVSEIMKGFQPGKFVIKFQAESTYVGPRRSEPLESDGPPSSEFHGRGRSAEQPHHARIAVHLDELAVLHDLGRLAACSSRRNAVLAAR